jgi:hypothetical protein
MTWAQLVAAAEELRAAAGPAGLPIAGIGWATVDLERAQGELDGLIAGDPAAPSLLPWAPLERDPGLGARGSVRAPIVAAPTVGAPADRHAPPALTVLEPDTEGRLAASLAKFGEGVLVLYLGEGLPRPGRLVPGRPAWGPNVVVLGPDDRARP